MTTPADSFLLRPVQRMLDRGVRYSTTAEALCEHLEGSSLQIRPGPADWSAYFIVTDGRLLLKHGQAEEPTATISGSLVNLARLAGEDPEAAIRDGSVKISGDADVANEFRALLDIVRPDWEEELSKVLGDPVAHELGRAFRSFGEWRARARKSFGRSIGEFLTEETRDLAARAEVDEFCEDVDALALDVERIEARFRLLKQQLQGKVQGTE